MTENKEQIQPIVLIQAYFFWEDTEKPLVEGILHGDADTAAESFHKYLNYMKITRNLKGQSAREIFTLAKTFAQKASEETSVNALAEALRHEKLTDKVVLVAASKILWVFDHTAIIMDTQTRKALGTLSEKRIKDKDYATYCKLWKEQYAIAKPQIQALAKQYDLQKLSAVFNEEWFLMRVFDTYLWKLGK